MSSVIVRGLGAVSPAGWGVAALREAVAKGDELPCRDLTRPGTRPLVRGRAVPAPSVRPAFFAHPRLRRASAISQFTVGAALEALGENRPAPAAEAGALGIILCVMNGCVNYSRRFYDEALRDPATASPLIFPETVFNAPGSHLASVLGSRAISYTLVGDAGVFLHGLALAAEWLLEARVARCLVIGAEELDPFTAGGARLFSRSMITSEGAGALLLGVGEPEAGAVTLEAITEPRLFWDQPSRLLAARQVRDELLSVGPPDVIVSSLSGAAKLDAAEALAWSDRPGARLAPKRVVGEGLGAAAAWQCVVAVDALTRPGWRQAAVPVTGTNEQAVGAVFQRAAAS